MLNSCVANQSATTPYRTLSEVDWIVVDIARNDGPLSLNPDGLWARISRTLLRLPVGHPLTDVGLEALRRFCVRAWYWNFIRNSDIKALVTAGYSHVQAFQILAHVAGERGYSPTIEESAP